MNEPLFHIHCKADGSWLTSRPPHPNTTGRIFEHDAPDKAELTAAEVKAEGWSTPYIAVPVPPFGKVAFDPNGKDKEFAHDALTPTNGHRADIGKTLLCLYWLLSEGESGKLALQEWANQVKMTEEPELTLCDMLSDMMHYCHREGIPWHGDGAVNPNASRRFTAESGGAVI